MPLWKRLGDLGLALLLLPVVLPLAAAIGLGLRLLQGGPVLHRSTRIGRGGRPFRMLKFRTMRPDPADAGVSGGDKARRITCAGVWLRGSRADELPQLWNILIGDMSFVGPRPPLPRYVAARPALYARVLCCRPGLTGLATLRLGAWERRLLAPCRSAAETEARYLARCIPAKARLDLLYARRRSPALDLWILLATLRLALPRRRPGLSQILTVFRFAATGNRRRRP
ncbi:sugar transferase [Pseudooceanicola sp. CBS1P-1]|uniref:Sugar transferase n=1 Tax=Pseudooceanicola albus TaxID=2692189 RepID=A0A6L7G7X5_9RHOB|nr:sugar transferase [Pseudooceanicola endophyticus]MXN20039.1 sugar transferase [Pseudooceanicola albus]